MTFNRLLSSGAALLTAILLLASLASSGAIAAPAEPPIAAHQAQTTPVKPDIGSPPTKPPLPGGRQSPLRVMVPTDETWQALRAAGITDITQISPNLDPIASFSPGPRMNLFPGQPAGAPGFEAMPPTPFRTLAILVQFTDKPAQVSATFFDNLMFGTGAATVRGYYREVSYGLLDIVTLNLPSSLGWVMAPQTYSYYVNGQSCLGSYPRNCRRLTEDVVALVNPVVDFSRYDNDRDGYVDTVFIIHSGTGAEASGGSGNIIWSHSWWTYNEPYVDGVWVRSYTTEPEFWYSPGDMTHGVYVHELGHAFGLPDLYDIDYSSAGVGDWSLMSSGSWNGYLGSSPAHPDAWSRVYLGFNPVTNLTGVNGAITVLNVEQNRTNAIYRLNSGQPNEYWLLENRQKIGSDTALPGSGLLIWHVDDNLNDSNRYECREVNNYLCSGSTRHFRVALEQADGLLDLEYNRDQGDGGDPFPGSSSKTVFNFTSNPNSTSYYSATNWGVQLSQISVSSGTVTAYVGNPHVEQAPLLLSPANGSATNDNTPTFAWNAVPGLTAYRIQVSTRADFASTVINSTRSSTSLTPGTALADGLYYWRVQARGADGIWGLWSEVRAVTVDTVKPPKPTLLAPAAGSVLNTSQPELDWSDVTDAAYYELQIDNSSTFGSPEVFTTITASTYTATTPLPNGKYYWRVRTYDPAGNRSGWTSARSFTLAYAPAPLETVTPVFTSTPTAAIVGAGLIEAESDLVGRVGTWTAHQTAVASGGGYVYSSGSTADALTLTFSGAQISVIYVKHPALGVIVVEIDGSPIQLLDSAAPDSVFGAQATFTLAEGQHTLRVYPLTGTIALDAFLVEAAAVPATEPEATVTATDTPTPADTLLSPETFTPTPTGTLLSLETFTPEPTATDLPSVTPSPTPTLDPLSVWLEAESDAVTFTGQWARVDDGRASGGAYLLSGDWGDEALTLTFFGPRVAVLYLTGMSPARFDLEVDGQIVQTVTYAGDGADFSARLTLELSDGPHTLRLIVREGALAVDAFVVLPQPATLIPSETPMPTFTPTETLTPTPTFTETPSPTATPLPPTETPSAPPESS